MSNSAGAHADVQYQDKYNVVFMGNFLYPLGMANTKRIQHAVDYLTERNNCTVELLLIRQSHPGRNDSCLNGVHKGVRYRTIGADLSLGWELLYKFPAFLWAGFVALLKSRERARRNVLYLYSEPNIENVLFVVYARLLGYKIICDIVEDHYLVDPSAGWLSRLKARSAYFFTQQIHHFVHELVVISRQLQAKLEALTVGRIPVVMIPVTIDTRKFTAANQPFHEPVRFLYAGSFAEKDDIENLISAFELVRAKGHRAVLWLSGGGMKERINNLKDRIAVSPYRADITYFGFLTDENYYELLSRCDVPCMIRTNSLYANTGFPFKLGEYLATGKPVIASDISDVSMYLVNGIDVFLVSPESLSALELALCAVLTDSATAAIIGERGKVIASNHFDYQKAWSALELIFSRLFSDSSQ